MAEYSDGASLDGLQQVVDRLASRLGRSAAVDDTQGRLVVASQHFGDQDPLRVYAIITRTSDPRVMEHFRTHGIYDWTEPGRIPYNPEIEFKARVCLPIREQGILFGHLFLIDEDVADWEIDEAAEAVQHIGQLMYGRLVVREEAVRTSETLVQDLVSTDPMARTVAMKQLTDDRLVIAAEPTLAVQLRLIAAEEPARLELALRAAVEVATRTRFRETYLAWVRGGDALILLFGRAAAEEHGRAVAEAVIDALAETPGSTGSWPGSAPSPPAPVAARSPTRTPYSRRGPPPSWRRWATSWDPPSSASTAPCCGCRRTSSTRASTRPGSGPCSRSTARTAWWRPWRPTWTAVETRPERPRPSTSTDRPSTTGSVGSSRSPESTCATANNDCRSTSGCGSAGC